MATVPIPAFPTDNLYKFVAIGGLILIGLGFFILAVMDKEGFDFSSRRRLETEDRLRDAYFKLQSLASGSEGKRFTPKQVEEIIAASHDSQKEILRDEAEEYRELRTSRIILSFASIVVGSLMAIWGFRRWHLKVAAPFRRKT